MKKPLVLIVFTVALLLIGGRVSIAQIKIGNVTPVPKEPTATKAPEPTSQQPTSSSIPTSVPNAAPTTTTQVDCNLIDISQLVGSINQANLQEYVRNLVDDDSIPGHDELRSRASGTEGNRAEAAYISTHYDNNSITNERQFVPRVNSDNIIATIEGKQKNSVFIVGGHYDSVTTAAADDNGSGTAVVMEVARAIAESGFCPEYTLEFIDFTGEELGLYGSRHYVDVLPAGKEIKGMINLDMVSNPSVSGDCVNFVSGRHNPGNAIAQKAAEVDKRYLIGLNASAKSGSVGASDHYPFEVKGYPAVFGTECAFNSAVYHKPTDTSDKINYAQLAKTAKVVAATVVEMTK